MNAALSIHYDCDPGQDDAIAMLYGLGSERINIESISVAGGNVDVHQCVRNTLQILELTGKTRIPVYSGAEKPLLRNLHTLPHVFGETGMGGAEDLPSPVKKAESLSAVDMLTSSLATNVIVATAPLTNIAQAIQRDPDFAGRINHLIIMGGCVFPEPVHGHLGNFTTPGTVGVAEYNFAVDPEAAKLVFRSGIKNITLIGLDVTRGVLYGAALDRRLRLTGKNCAIQAANILSTVGEEDRTDYAALKTSPDDPVRAMHDVLAMAYCESPEIFTVESYPLRILIEGTPGQTIIDREDCDHPSVNVVRSIDKHAFLSKLVANLARLG